MLVVLYYPQRTRHPRPSPYTTPFRSSTNGYRPIASRLVVTPLIQDRAHQYVSNHHRERASRRQRVPIVPPTRFGASGPEVCLPRSEEHTSELQSRFEVICRLLLGKKK